MIPVVIVTFFAIVLVLRSVVVVPQERAFIVERLGQYHCTLMPATHVLLPFTDRVTRRYSLHPWDEEVADTCVTRDNVAVRITSVVRARILDPRRAAYGSADAGDSMVTLVRSRQRLWIGERAWEDVRASSRDLEAGVVAAAAVPAKEFGVHIVSVDVKSIERNEP